MIYKMKKVASPHDIKTTVPGSKSITNRALLIAALANGSSRLKGVLFSDDSRHFIQALIDLGFPVEVNEETKEVTITGQGGKIPKTKATVNVGSAGTAARFLTAYLGLSKGEYLLNSSEQMKKRPMKELILALEELGAKFSYAEEEYHFPYSVSNNEFAAYETIVDVDKSSQFLSALLISSVLFDKDLVIKVTGSHGMAYVEMTVKMMEQFGVVVERLKSSEYTAVYKISGDSKYNAMDYDIEPDVSAACYFYGMSPILNVKSMVLGVHYDSLQGDINFLRVLEKMGCSSEDTAEGIMVCPPKDKFVGGEFDLSAFSDQALTLAAIAPFADSKVEITGIGHIKFQECDRVNAILVNLKALGVDCSEGDGRVIINPSSINGASIKTFEDHRVAMSFALPGLVSEDVIIENPKCCGKTFENYFEVLEESVY